MCNDLNQYTNYIAIHTPLSFQPTSLNFYEINPTCFRWKYISPIEKKIDISHRIISTLWSIVARYTCYKSNISHKFNKLAMSTRNPHFELRKNGLFLYWFPLQNSTQIFRIQNIGVNIFKNIYPFYNCYEVLKVNVVPTSKTASSCLLQHFRETFQRIRAWPKCYKSTFIDFLAPMIRVLVNIVSCSCLRQILK